MKFAAMILTVSVAFVSQGLAVLRPPLPAKASPPFGGELIVIENDSIKHLANKAPAPAPR